MQLLLNDYISLLVQISELLPTPNVLQVGLVACQWLLVYGSICPIDKLNAKIIYSLCDTIVNRKLLLEVFFKHHQVVSV